ncbi:TPA: DUF2713 family protein [Escherichia coli]|nr:DUF2713 family protein [Escherichia coli]
MSSIIGSSRGYFNKSLNSNQYDNKNVSSEKLKDMYNKSVDYATMSNRAAIIAKIDLFIQRITHNLWTASEKNVSLIGRINALKDWVDECIVECTNEQLGDRDYISAFVERAIFHYAMDFVCNPMENSDATLIDRCTFDVINQNDLPSAIQLFYDKPYGKVPVASLHLKTVSEGFLNLENAYKAKNDARLKPLASLLLSFSYGSASADIIATARRVNDYCENYITSKIKILSRQVMKKSLMDMKELVDKNELDFNLILNERKKQAEEDNKDITDITKMQAAGETLIKFVQSFDPDSTGPIVIGKDMNDKDINDNDLINEDIIKFIYDLFGIVLKK